MLFKVASINNRYVSRKNRGLVILILAIAILLISSLSLLLNNFSVKGFSAQFFADTNKVIDDANMTYNGVITKSNDQEFQCDIVYAYVGKGNSSDVSLVNGHAEYPISQYPSAIYFNFTKRENNAPSVYDVIIEVYVIDITTDKESTEKYVWLEGTNLKSGCDDFGKVQIAATYVDDLISRRTVTGQGGHFKFNWAAGRSVVGGCIGSIGRYTNHPSKLGLWSTGQPNEITVNIRLIGWITIDGDSISTIKNNENTDSFQEIQLQQFESGFIHNKILPSDQLLGKDLFNPLID